MANTRKIKAVKYGTETLIEVDIPADATCSLKDCGGTPLAAIIFEEPRNYGGVIVKGKFLLCLDHLLTTEGKITNH
jgi:hypothetical protein